MEGLNIKQVIVKAHPMTKDHDRSLPPESQVIFRTEKGDIQVLMGSDYI